MKQNLSKGAALGVALSLLCAILLVCSGCGGNKDKEALIGEWETSLDLTDMINDEMKAGAGNDEELMRYFTISDFSVALTLTFRDDDTYTLSADQASMEKSVDHVIETLRNGFSSYLEDMVAQEYPEMTMDEFFEAAGTTMDEFFDETFGGAFDKENLMSSTDDMESSGTFSAKNGILTLTDEEGPGLEAYELDGDKLTLTGQGVEDSSLMGLYPLAFTKK